MIRAPLAALLALTLLLPSLAHAQEITYICTTMTNSEDGSMSAEIHYPDGQSIALNAYSDGVQRSEIIRVSAVESIVPILWELAEPVLDLPPEDVSTGERCNPQFLETLIVGFSDGTTRRRDEICINGALSQMASEVIWAVPRDRDVRDVKRDVIEERVEDPADVCGRQW